MMDALLADLRYALRTLARSPGLSLAAVLTLGLGIGANTAMFGVVDRLFFRPPAHVVDPDRVVRLYVTWSGPQWGISTTSIGSAFVITRVAGTSAREALSICVSRPRGSW